MQPRAAGTGPTVREAISGDRKAISDLHVQSWRRAYRGILPDGYLDQAVEGEFAARWATIFDRGDARDLLLVADDDGQLAGFLYAFRCDDAGGYELDNLHIAPVFQGRGVGTALMRDASRHLVARGAKSVVLYVIEGNDAACRFYERLGGRALAPVAKTLGSLGAVSAIPFRWDDASALGG